MLRDTEMKQAVSVFVGSLERIAQKMIQMNSFAMRHCVPMVGLVLKVSVLPLTVNVLVGSQVIVAMKTTHWNSFVTEAALHVRMEALVMRIMAQAPYAPVPVGSRERLAQMMIQL